MTVIPVAYIAAGSSDAGLGSEEGTLATYGFMMAYGLVALAAPLYLRKIGENKTLAWVLGVFGAVTMVFIFYVNWIPTAIPNDIFPPLVGAFKALPYVFLVWTAVGPDLVLRHQVQQARHSSRHQAPGVTRPTRPPRRRRPPTARRPRDRPPPSGPLEPPPPPPPPPPPKHIPLTTPRTSSSSLSPPPSPSEIPGDGWNAFPFGPRLR